ncbi:MAG: tetratricopeptide repeat protein [Spirochaetes bacterium]|nr:tetratricopeptide repeat protein [Spirochaetota bacterium]
MIILQRGLSRNLLVGILTVFFVLMATMVITFYVLMAQNSKLVESFLVRASQEYALTITSHFVGKFQHIRFSTVEQIEKELKNNAPHDISILGTIAFARTADESYFRVLSKISFNATFTIPIERGALVASHFGSEYLKKGLLRPTVEPAVHMHNSIAWLNVYYPFTFQNRNAVLCVMVSSTENLEAIKDYQRSLAMQKKIVLAVHFVAAVVVISILFFFIRNYQLILRYLASSLQRAKAGDFSVSISAAGDDELFEVASSFNSLIEELKTLKGKHVHASENVLAKIFTMGVEKLKKGECEDAIHLFYTLTLFRPESFGSFFNLGVAYAKMRRYEESLQMFDRALEMNPQHELALLYKTKVQDLQMKYGERASGH